MQDVLNKRVCKPEHQYKAISLLRKGNEYQMTKLKLKNEPENTHREKHKIN